MKQVDGSCVKITRERAVVTKKVQEEEGQGGLRRADAVRPGVEDQADRRQARRPQAHARRCRSSRPPRKEFAKVGDKDDGAAGARYYYALGKIAEADVEFEKYLDIKFPANLNFGDGLPEHKKQNEELAKKSKKRFNDWLDRQEQGGGDGATRSTRPSSRSRTTRTRSPRPPASVRSRRTSRTSCSPPRSRRTFASRR